VSLELCACGKELFETWSPRHLDAPGHHHGEQSVERQPQHQLRQRSWSLSAMGARREPGSSQSEPSLAEARSSSSLLLLQRRDSRLSSVALLAADVDIEDVVVEPQGHEAAVVSAAPRLLVTPKIGSVAPGTLSRSASATSVNSRAPLTPTVSEFDLSTGAGAATVAAAVAVELALEPPEEEEEEGPAAAASAASKRLFGPLVCERCARQECASVHPTVGFYSMRQVQKHCSADDCWIVAHGVVYDVTRYISKHPGGSLSILSRVGGADASNDYDFHSNNAKQRTWIKYRIGRLALCDGEPHRARGSHAAAQRQDDSCVLQ
jgi:hypothetical protein